MVAGCENSAKGSRGVHCDPGSEYMRTPCTDCTCWTRDQADSEPVLQNEQVYSRGSEKEEIISFFYNNLYTNLYNNYNNTFLKLCKRVYFFEIPCNTINVNF